MSGLLLPVLFWKPGVATAPVLELSLVPGGGASPHSSVRRPFEVLDQTAPLDTPVLRTLLPRFSRLEHYACAYRFPPRDVDQFVDEFPRGLSHLLAVSLALYALGADHTLGGSRFRDRLAGWTAVGHPSKTGGIEASDHVQAKLDALAREQDELAGIGVTVSSVLVPAADRADTSRAPDGVRIHFIGTFQEALETVFGVDLLRAYSRKRRPGVKLRMPAALALLLTGSLLLAFRDAGTPVLAVPNGSDPYCVDIHQDDGRVVVAGPFRGKVVKTDVAQDADGNAFAVVIGLAHEGPDMGYLIWLERDWLGRWTEIWRRRPFGDRLAGTGEPLRLGVSQVEALELFDEHAGPEVLASFGGVDYPATICAFTSRGELIGQMWHPGIVGHWIVLRDPTRLVFGGANNRLRGPEKDPEGEGLPWDTVFFCIRPEDLRGRGPCHYDADDMPVGFRELAVAPFLWYRRLRQTTLNPYEINADCARQHPDAEFTIMINREWHLAIGHDGTVLERVQGEPKRIHDQQFDLELVELR